MIGLTLYAMMNVRKKITFRNKKLFANANFIEKIVDLMNQRVANNDRKYRVSFSQTQNNFKELVSKCKSAKVRELSLV